MDQGKTVEGNYLEPELLPADCRRSTSRNHQAVYRDSGGEMKKQRAYRFRIYPNKEQEKLIHKTFGCCRFVYNRMLSERKEIYEKTGKAVRLTPAKCKKEYVWLKEVDSLALANVQLNLEAAYQKFFKEEKAGFPKFKSKHRS